MHVVTQNAVVLHHFFPPKEIANEWGLTPFSGAFKLDVV
jgi:hypothetical protein